MRRPALLSQVLAVNTLLLGAALAAAVMTSADAGYVADRRGSVLLVAAILATVLANGVVLRRRFQPLESLVETMERVDLTRPGVRARPVHAAEPTDVLRLREAFNRMLARVEAERASAARAVLRAQEQERARLARDLHDEVNQALTAVALRLQASAEGAPEALAEELDETRRLTGRAMDELLRLARELRPTALDDHGLLPALRTLVTEFGRRWGIDAEFSAAGPSPSLNADQQIVVYRVVQESLSNIARHSGAQVVRVSLATSVAGRLLVTITDDGHGFGALERDRGLGMRGMRERAMLVGAWLAIRSSGSGTTVELVVPATEPGGQAGPHARSAA